MQASLCSRERSKEEVLGFRLRQFDILHNRTQKVMEDRSGNTTEVPGPQRRDSRESFDPTSWDQLHVCLRTQPDIALA